MNVCDCGKEYVPTSKGNGAIMCKSCVSNRRRFELKKKAVDYLGGKCIDCGYDRYLEALEFDHIDPTLKEFSISGSHGRSWDVIKAELDKCALRCANCHRERHAKERKSPLPYVMENHILTTECESCGVEFSHIASEDRRYCSVQCVGESSKRIKWPSVEVLTNMIEGSSFIKVAEQLGVSDNAIRKHLIRQGIDPKTIRNVKNNRFMRL